MGFVGDLVVIAAALMAVGCSSPRIHAKDDSTEEKVTIELREQPVVRDGTRTIYAIDLRAVPFSERRAALDRAVRTIRLRLQIAGIAGHVAIDKDQLIVDFPAIDPEVRYRAHELIVPVGHLEFRFAEAGSGFMKKLTENVTTDRDAHITGESEQWVTRDRRRVTDWYLQASDRDQTLTAEEARKIGCATYVGPATFTCVVSGRVAIDGYVAALAKRDPSFVMPKDRMLLFEREASRTAPSRWFWRSYLVERTTEIPLVAMRHATARINDDGGSEVEIELDRAGTRALIAATEKHVGDKLAFVLDGQVLSASLAESTIRGGRVVIPIDGGEPDYLAEAARNLPILLTSGELPGALTELIFARLVDGVPKDDQP